MLNGNNTSLFEFCHIETINANDKESKKKISNNNTLEDFKKDETFDPRSYDHLVRLTNIIRQLADVHDHPSIGIICGSGLGNLADKLSGRKVIPYSEIPGFPRTKVVGHKGNMVFGYLGGKFVICLQGRIHPYEANMDLVLCSMPVRIMYFLGVKTLIVSNAAGGLNPEFKIGNLMLIKDHIFMPGLAGFSPLRDVDDRFGSKFVSLHNCYAKELSQMTLDVANELDIVLHKGVYVMNAGPQYESPAECRLLKLAGADALGMSTCHEVIVAAQCKINVVGISLITNMLRTDSDESIELSHKEVLEVGESATEKFCLLISTLVEKIT